MERLTYRDKFGQALAYKSQYAEVTNKLAHYEDLEEHLQKLYGECDELLDVCVNALERFELKIGNPQKTRMLTDDEADLWDKWRVANEQGRLIELPCKVGDWLYYVFSEFRVVVPIRLNDVIISFLGIDNYSYQYNCCSFDEVGDVYEDFEFDNDDVGKTVFLTEEEAKQALADMQKG